jgi:uncharacterized protein YneF (UPF0154 family)
MLQDEPEIKKDEIITICESPSFQVSITIFIIACLLIFVITGVVVYFITKKITKTTCLSKPNFCGSFGGKDTNYNGVKYVNSKVDQQMLEPYKSQFNECIQNGYINGCGAWMMYHPEGTIFCWINGGNIDNVNTGFWKLYVYNKNDTTQIHDKDGIKNERDLMKVRFPNEIIWKELNFSPT